MFFPMLKVYYNQALDSRAGATLFTRKWIMDNFSYSMQFNSKVPAENKMYNPSYNSPTNN